MSKIHDLRDPDQTRRLLVQGVWLSRVRPPSAATLRTTIRYALEVVSAGHPMPPPGFIADLGNLLFDTEWATRSQRELPTLPNVSPSLICSYEDRVLGKFDSDQRFGRAVDALRRLGKDEEGRQRGLGLSYLLEQLRRQSKFGGLDINPASVRVLGESPPTELLEEGWKSLSQEGLDPLLHDLYLDLIACTCQTGDILTAADLFELERGIALAEYGERHAVRQIHEAASQLETNIPDRKPPPFPGRTEVTTRILDEDTYPVGGFSSLSTRGSIESLLHSQLAYMERGGPRPDLFDIKYLRDELLYYARDENQFHRRRRTFLIVLHDDLAQTRVKDRGLPYQRGVLLLALLWVLVRRLSEWLGDEGLMFEFVFVAPKGADSLARERELLRMILRQEVDQKTARIPDRPDATPLTRVCADRSRRSQVHCLMVSTVDRPLQTHDAVVTRLVIDGPCPGLANGEDEPIYEAVEEPLDAWVAVGWEILQRWI